jgi:hypothetical protein
MMNSLEVGTLVGVLFYASVIDGSYMKRASVLAHVQLFGTAAVPTAALTYVIEPNVRAMFS